MCLTSALYSLPEVSRIKGEELRWNSITNRRLMHSCMSLTHAVVCEATSQLAEAGQVQVQALDCWHLLRSSLHVSAPRLSTRDHFDAKPLLESSDKQVNANPDTTCTPQCTLFLFRCFKLLCTWMLLWVLQTLPSNSLVQHFHNINPCTMTL